MGVNPRPNLTSDLDDWGMETLTRLLGVGTPDPKLGFDPDAYLPTSCVTLPEGNRDKRAQLGMMGLRSGVEVRQAEARRRRAKVRRCYVIDDLERFANFAKLIRDAQPQPNPTPEPAPDELTALEPRGRDFGAVETQLGAMGWTGQRVPVARPRRQRQGARPCVGARC